MAAPESKLSAIHDALATYYAKLLEDGGTVVGKDEEGEDIVMPLTPAMVQAINKFLKDNEITCAPDDLNAIGELEDRMKLRSSRREARRQERMATASELAEAGGAFLGGVDPLRMQ